jgi:hypothetical protein
MDGLLAEINKRKASDFGDADSSGARKYVKRGDAAREHEGAARRQREEERQKLEEEDKRKAEEAGKRVEKFKEVSVR